MYLVSNEGIPDNYLTLYEEERIRNLRLSKENEELHIELKNALSFIKLGQHQIVALQADVQRLRAEIEKFEAALCLN